MAVFNATKKDQTYNGANGVVDTVNYASLNANITPNHDGILVDLGAGLAQYTSFGTRFDDLNSIENIIGSELGDTLRGSAVRNVLNGFDGNDEIDGESGDDLLVGGNGDDTVDGGSGEDALQGDAGDDILNGGNDDDILNGGAGNDDLSGNSGDDTFLGGAGADEHSGSTGIDTVSFAASSGGVVVNLDQGRGFNGDAAGDRYSSIENAIGTAFDDTLIGRTGSNVLEGGAGDDVISGGAGDDVIIGGAGSDTATFFLATLIDLVAGVVTGDGNDILVDIENVRATQFADTVRGSAGANVLEGEAGGDLLVGRGGGDLLIGGNGNDRLDGQAGSDRLEGGADNDAYVVRPGQGDDVIFDEAGNNDKLIVESLDDIDASARVGDDLLIILNGGGSVRIQNHFAGNAVEFVDPLDGPAVVLATGVIGGGGSGIISGTRRDDLLSGRGGDDLLYGVGGDDLLKGGRGDDLLAGGAGDDLLKGGRGNDLLAGGAGDDLLKGGARADTFRFARGEGTDLLADFGRGDDLIEFDRASFRIAADATVADVVRIGGAAPTAGLAFHVTGRAIIFDADWSDAAGRETLAFFAPVGGAATSLDDFTLV